MLFASLISGCYLIRCVVCRLCLIGKDCLYPPPCLSHGDSISCGKKPRRVIYFLLLPSRIVVFCVWFFPPARTPPFKSSSFAPPPPAQPSAVLRRCIHARRLTSPPRHPCRGVVAVHKPRQSQHLCAAQPRLFRGGSATA